MQLPLKDSADAPFSTPGGTTPHMEILLVLLADTHGFHRRIRIPDGDILVVAGDFCMYGDFKELDEFNAFLGKLPHKHKVVVAGNHDICMERSPEYARSRLTNAVYLQDQAVTLMGLSLYGSPWQPQFMDWAFNLPQGEALKRKWDLIPPNTDVLITHGPPYGFGDTTEAGEHAGDQELAKAIKRIKPKINVFGHIHEGYGSFRLGETTLINASVCDGMYQPVNPPILVSITT
jgi:Icc-related predicted phosphoesterase